MSRILESALTPAQRQECEANDLRLARAMAPGLDRAATCRATGNHLAAQNDEPEWDRGPLTQPVELTDQSAWDAFDLKRGGPGKGERLARVNDQHAANLQIQYQGCIGGLPR